MVRSVSQRISFDDLKLFCKQAYIRAGVPDGEAEIAAGLLARSDLRGTETHGVMRLPIYIQRLQKGYVRAVCNMTMLKKKGPRLSRSPWFDGACRCPQGDADGHPESNRARYRVGLGQR